MDMYLITVVTLAFMALAIYWFWKIRHQQVNVLASIVTVIGVLGTFVGIAWGLWNFNTDDIQNSVPKLLGGLKAAFFTSILGIVGSIWLKWSNLHKQKGESHSEERSGATVDDLAGLLRNILEVEKEEGKETRESLQSIEKSLTGEGDSTVLTQLQKLRTTFSDKQDDLVRAFNEFSEQMAENNTQALIEALEEVMRDFNAKINEQFGDNFRQLNEAVGRINDWQEQYRQQMNELAAQFRIAAESVEQSRQSLAIIADRSDAIVSSAEQLDPILRALQHQIGQLDTHLEAFSTLAENAGSAFPIIEARLNQLTDGFSTVVQETIDNSHASMQSQREALANQSQQLETTVVNTGNHIQQQTEAVFERTSERVEQVIADAFQDYRSALEDQSQQLQSTIITTNRGLEDTLQKQSTHLQTMVENASGRLEEIANRFSTVVREAIDNSHASVQSLQEAVREFSVHVTESIDNSHADMARQREAFQNVTVQVESVIQNISQQLKRTIEDLTRDLGNTVQAQSTLLRSETERFFQGSTERMDQQFQRLDTALQQELEKSINSLGRQLASLSSRFVADYTPLTEQLRRVVQIARRLE